MHEAARHVPDAGVLLGEPASPIALGRRRRGTAACTARAARPRRQQRRLDDGARRAWQFPSAASASLCRRADGEIRAGQYRRRSRDRESERVRAGQRPARRATMCRLSAYQEPFAPPKLASSMAASASTCANSNTARRARARGLVAPDVSRHDPRRRREDRVLARSTGTRDVRVAPTRVRATRVARARRVSSRANALRSNARSAPSTTSIFSSAAAAGSASRTWSNASTTLNQCSSSGSGTCASRSSRSRTRA